MERRDLEKSSKPFKLPKHYVRSAGIEEDEDEEKQYDADEEVVFINWF